MLEQSIQYSAPRPDLVEIDHYRGQWWSKYGGAALLLGVVWAACLVHLSTEWMYNPEYRHGWLMPLAVAAILLRRIRYSPLETSVNRVVLSRGAILLSIAVLSAWFPLRIIATANPDWHLAAWITFAAALSLTVVVAQGFGGREGVKSYAVPFLMIAGAIPLPFFLEQNLIAFLKDLTASGTLELLHIFGIAAFREARDLIALKDVVLGIEDGCSGIRSLHLCLAAGLFWGELNRLTIGVRALLILIGVIAALALNIVRSTALAFVAEAWGAEGFERYHEAIGTGIQFSTLGVFAVAGAWLMGGVARRGIKSTGAISSLFETASGGMRISGGVFCVAAVLVCAAEAGRIAWFSLRSSSQGTVQWLLHEPEAAQGFHRVPLPSHWSRKLGANKEYSGEWSNDRGQTRAVHYFQWSDRNPARMAAGSHRPEICLAGVGFEMIGSPEERMFRVGDASLRFDRYQFTRQGEDVIIYFGLWDTWGNEMMGQSGTAAATMFRSDRIKRAWQGIDQTGRRLIELGFWSATASEADAELQIFLNEHVIPVN